MKYIGTLVTGKTITMNKLFYILLLSSSSFCYADNNLCNSTKTSDLEQCLEQRIEMLHKDIRKLELNRQSKLLTVEDNKQCQEIYDEIYPGKEANIEKLLCMESKLESKKEILLRRDTHLL